MITRLYLLVAIVGVAEAYDCQGTGGETDVYPGCGEEACTANDFCEQRNGSCVETDIDPFFRCDCAEDYANLTPLYCMEQDGDMPDPCNPDPCASESAECQPMNNTWTPTCICPDLSEVGYNEECPGGYDANDLEEGATCDSDPCGLGADCMMDANVAVCMCYNSATQGYEKTDYGEACEDPVTVTCSNNPCGSNAKCYDHNPGFKCACRNGEYKDAGQNCLDTYPSVPCDADLKLCDDHASCETVFLETICTCDPPYQGNGFECTKPGNSEKDAAAGTASGDEATTGGDACSSDPCGKHATCEAHGTGMYQCFCGDNKVPNTVSCS
jgi:hypothetical protein